MTNAQKFYQAMNKLGYIENGVSVVNAYGTSGIQLGASATLFGTIQATGTAGVQFGASATLIGVLLATGAAQIVISSTGEAYLATNAAVPLKLPCRTGTRLHGMRR
jgi:hypothetical protein